MKKMKSFFRKRTVYGLVMVAVLCLMSQGASAAVGYSVVRSSGTYSGCEASLLFDENPATKWAANNNHEGYDNGWWVIFKTTEAICPSSYRLQTANDTQIYSERNWKTWKIYGANFQNDDEAQKGSEEWKLLDNKEVEYGDMPASNYAIVEFDMSELNTEKYNYYMIYVGDIFGAMTAGTEYLHQMAEFRFVDDNEFIIKYEALDGSKSAFGASFDYTSLVDNNLATKWACDKSNEGYDNGWWIVFKSDNPILPEYYTLTLGDDTGNGYNAGRNWKSWKIYAANFDTDEAATKDSEGWVLIDQKWNIGTDEMPATSLAKVIFGLSEGVKEKFQYFKIEVLEIGDATLHQMQEFAFGTSNTMKDLIVSIHQKYSDLENSFAYKQLADEYDAALATLKNAKDYQSMMDAQKTLGNMRANLEESVLAYKTYQQAVDYASHILKDYNDNLTEEGKTYLNGYLNDMVLPGDKYSNGSYPYILENKQLTSEEIAVESNKLKAKVNGFIIYEDEEPFEVEYEALAGTGDFNNIYTFHNLVDGNINSAWTAHYGNKHCSPTMGVWVVFKASEPIKPTLYSLTTGSNPPKNNWKTWKIYAANFDPETVDGYSTEEWMNKQDGWVLIDEKTDIGSDQLPLDPYTSVFFNMSEILSEKYQYFKIEVRNIVFEVVSQMAELQFGNKATQAQAAEVYYNKCADFDLNVIAQKSLISEYESKLAELKDCKEATRILELYYGLLALQESITDSKNGYIALQDSVQKVKDYVDSHPDLSGKTVERLQAFLNDNIEPNASLPHGSYSYIMENLLLTGTEARIEANNVTEMLESILRGGYTVLSGTDDWNNNATFGKSVLFDGQIGTKWFNNGINNRPVYVIFRSDMPLCPSLYTLVTGDDTANNSGRNWSDWDIYGANFADDSEADAESEAWVLIDHKEGIGQDRLPAANFATRYFGLSEDPTQEYQYYKLVIRKAYDGDMIQMAEFKFGTTDDMEEIKLSLLEGADLNMDKIAQQSLLDECEELIGYYEDLTNVEELISVSDKIKALTSSIKKSETAYKEYEQRAADVKAYLEAHPEMQCEERDALEDFMNDYIEPNESYARGSYQYVMENHLLNEDDLREEKENLSAMLRQVILVGYTAGMDVTRLISNADFSDGMYSWENNGFTSGGMKDVFPIATFINKGKAKVSQTLTGLKNGIYRINLNGFYANYDNTEASSYGAILIANDMIVPLMMIKEGALAEENCVDLENCYITEAGTSPYDMITDYGYIPSSAVGCSYAFHGNRYENSLLVNVTDGELNLGVEVNGYGTDVRHFVAIGDFQLIYLGADGENAEQMETALESPKARAQFLTNYEVSYGTDFAEYPSYSNAIRTELQNVAGFSGMDAMNKLSDLFKQQYECKIAYLEYTKALVMMEDAVYNSSQYSFTEDQKNSYRTLSDSIWDNIFGGVYSTEEAQNQSDLRNSPLYIYMYGVVPALADGIYQIGSANELKWFSFNVNNYDNTIKGKLINDVDMASLESWNPIGSASRPFQGTFDGNGYAIQNFNYTTSSDRFGLFGTLKGAAVGNFAISGNLTCTNKITGAIAYAEGSLIQNVQSFLHIDASATGVSHVAGVVADLMESSIVERCAFSGNISVGADNTDSFGGVVAFSNTGIITNCANYGNITFENENCYAGGILGYVSNQDFGGIQNCLAVGAITSTTGSSQVAGVLVGWLRKFNPDNIVNNYWAQDKGPRASGQNESEQNVSATAEELASGAVCYALNEGQNGIIWFQTLGEDATPVLDATHDKVSKNQNGTYTNDENSVKGIASQTENTPIYLLNGIKVNKAQKGMYIQNGKKMLKK